MSAAGLLTSAAEHPTGRGRTGLENALQAGDPTFKVTLAWHAHQKHMTALAA